MHPSLPLLYFQFSIFSLEDSFKRLSVGNWLQAVSTAANKVKPVHEIPSVSSPGKGHLGEGLHITLIVIIIIIIIMTKKQAIIWNKAESVESKCRLGSGGVGHPRS